MKELGSNSASYDEEDDLLDPYYEEILEELKSDEDPFDVGSPTAFLEEARLDRAIADSRASKEVLAYRLGNIASHSDSLSESESVSSN